MILKWYVLVCINIQFGNTIRDVLILASFDAFYC